MSDVMAATALPQETPAQQERFWRLQLVVTFEQSMAHNRDGLMFFLGKVCPDGVTMSSDGRSFSGWLDDPIRIDVYNQAVAYVSDQGWIENNHPGILRIRLACLRDKAVS